MGSIRVLHSWGAFQRSRASWKVGEPAGRRSLPYIDWHGIAVSSAEAYQEFRLSENLISRRLAMRRIVSRLSHLGKLLIELAPSTILVTQGTVLGQAVPWIKGEIVRKRQLRW